MTPALLAVLEALLVLDRPYGQQVMERSRRPSGTVYPLLARMENEGWVTSEWENEDPNERRPRRRYYSLTSTGEQHAYEAVKTLRTAQQQAETWVWSPG